MWEWFVVEAFIRAEDSLSGISGIPGVQKVQRALRNQRPVSASSYLKTPTAFGFTGVFRRLASGIGVLTDDGRLDDGGYELVTAWAKDQSLEGFIDAPSHPFRDRLRRAVAQGLEKGHTTYQTGEFWKDLARRLDPSAPGRSETKVLLDRILLRSGPEDMIARLKEALIAEGGVSERQHEPPFLRKLTRKVSPDLAQQLLTAIDAYETFGRTITVAFDGLRHCASINGAAPVDAQAFSSTKAAKSALSSPRSQPRLASARIRRCSNGRAPRERLRRRWIDLNRFAPAASCSMRSSTTTKRCKKTSRPTGSGLGSNADTEARSSSDQATRCRNRLISQATMCTSIAFQPFQLSSPTSESCGEG